MDGEADPEQLKDQPVKKHTLDSDEEEEEEDSKKYNVMDPDEIEGEEDDTITKDGDIQITPFNMKEEMNEGHFDAEGNYFWKKEVEIRDAWLDNIDDTKQYTERDDKEESEEESSDDQTEAVKESDKAAMYEQMLELMQSRESVAKALRRLGGDKSRSASARWKQKRAGDGAGTSESAESAADRERLDRLTGLADRLLSAGNMEVYQLTREAVSHQLQLLRKPIADRLQGAATEEDALDMFAESLDKTAAGTTAPATAGTTAPASDGTTAPASDAPRGNGTPGGGEETKSSAETAALDESVSWQFKWEESESAEVHGPHSSSEMNAWVESGYFSDLVRVRKTGTVHFYPVRRVDFDLYM